MKRYFALLPLLLAAVTISCRKEKPSQPGGPETQITACELITAEEIGKIQGTTISGSSESQGAIGTLLARQCYYSSNEPNKSVTLGVIQRGPGQSVDPVEYWRETFEGTGDRDKDRGSEKKSSREKEEEDEKRVPPQKITGLGDDARWVGSVIGGTFYVLDKKRHLFLRVSVGGPDSRETKLEKSKEIAAKALGRL